MNTIRTGIIGVGNMGTAHARRLYEGHVRGMELTAVCDIAPERLTACAALFPGVQCFDSAEALIESKAVDAVIIAVPHPLHGVIGAMSLHSGLHTLIEKPLDISLTQAGAPVLAAKESGRVFALMLNQRTNPLFRKAREIVQGGLLGEMKRSVWIVTNWYRSQAYYDSGDWRATWSGEGGGVLLNQAPHNLDLWQWICGMPVQVTAMCDTARYHRIEVEDDAAIHVRYANGATGTFITSTGEYPGTNRLEISGTLGKLVLEDGRLKWWRLKENEEQVRFTAQAGMPSIPYEYEEILPDGEETGHTGILQNFADAVLNGAPLLSPGADGLNELTISNAAYLSQWLGNRPVDLPMDQKLFDRMLAEKQASSKGHNAPEKRENISGSYSERWQVRW